ncbi:MAG: toprim domain-containing protein [Ilumatobacteraceae bacterium]
MTPERRPRWEIGDVLARTDLTALLDELALPGTHHVRGRRWHCPVPDHDDHHASVTIHTDHRGHERWRCWSGDDTHRGDAIDLVVVTQRLPRADAIDWLARRAGMIPDHPLPPVHRKPRPAVARFVPLDPAVVRYAEACERILWSNGGREVRDWLHGRGFTDALLRANHVGADPGRRMLPRRRGLPHGASSAAVFPALDPNGRIHYLQARYLDPAGDKYDNPAGSLGSNPRLSWTRTPDAVTRQDVLVVCEGIPDAMTASAAGFAAVGVLGSQAPDERVAVQLARHADERGQRLVAVVDADAAGRAWGRRLGELLEAQGAELTTLEPTVGGDLNEWARRDSAWSRADGLASAAGSRIVPTGPATELTASS